MGWLRKTGRARQLRQGRRKEGRKGGGAAAAAKANLIPSSLFPAHPSYPSDAVSLSLFLSPRLFRSSAFCPAPVFDPFSCRFGGLTITNIAGAIPPAPARLCGRQNNGPRRARGAGRRGALLIKYLKQSMKANKKCHVGVGSGAEKGRGGRIGLSSLSLSLSVCLA